MAISPVLVYGFMQIVPTSAGRDISKRIEGKERIFSSKELYDGNININLERVIKALFFICDKGKKGEEMYKHYIKG